MKWYIRTTLVGHVYLREDGWIVQKSEEYAHVWRDEGSVSDEEELHDTELIQELNKMVVANVLTS